MLKTILIALLIFISATVHSQTTSRAAFLEEPKEFQTVLFPIMDSMGIPVFIKPSIFKDYRHPTKNTKIWVFNYLMDTLGYYKGVKLKFVKLPVPL